MTEPVSTAQATAKQAADAFSLRIHFEGAFVFFVETDNNQSNSDTPVTGVKIYAPTCEHLHAATINKGSTYMLENYWHCIDPSCAPNPAPAAIQLGALKAALKADTPMLSSTRPIGSGWTLAVNLPGPQEWRSEGPVPTTDPTTNQPCFSGRSASIIPAQVATTQVLIYTQVTSVEFHGACFDPAFQPIDGFVDLYISSEMPSVIPTVPHQARAIASMASLLGMDLVFQYPLPKGSSSSGAFTPKTVHAGGCSPGIVTMPGSTK